MLHLKYAVTTKKKRFPKAAKKVLYYLLQEVVVHTDLHSAVKQWPQETLYTFPGVLDIQSPTTLFGSICWSMCCPYLAQYWCRGCSWQNKAYWRTRHPLLTEMCWMRGCSYYKGQCHHTRYISPWAQGQKNAAFRGVLYFPYASEHSSILAKVSMPIVAFRFCILGQRSEALKKLPQTCVWREAFWHNLHI